MTLADRCRQIELLVLDVDGVLSDGAITYSADGVEIKNFFVRDGLAIKLWQMCGKQLALLSGRSSECTRVRAAELGIDLVIQHGGAKLPGLTQVMEKTGVRREQVGFVGDDLPDVPILLNCGLAAAVADACPEVLRLAHFVAQAPGGRGAVREVIELILRCQRHWQRHINRVLRESL
jgi:3-deoxy-D-manno-octulosonate 8-phosphate phosphatase (KDO 8-P phosphatase)